MERIVASDRKEGEEKGGIVTVGEIRERRSDDTMKIDFQRVSRPGLIALAILDNCTSPPLAFPNEKMN